MSWPHHLCHWYRKNKREMPWRDDPTPYRTWISEMMLQQTQVDTVIPYFNRFMDRFPRVQDLAAASIDEVLKLWEGLGYYSRARYCHKAAQLITESFNGELPSDFETLQTLPGIGSYCAAAITSIAFHQPVPVIDGNVLRVFTRFWAIPDDIAKNTTKTQLFNKLLPFIQSENPSDFNQAMMELGATVCKPSQPQCEKCPLQKECLAFKDHRIEDFPYKAKKKPVPHYDIGIGVIWHNKKVLIGKRKSDQMLGGLWEFPGGKKEENEDIKDTVIREVKEETNLDIVVGKKYGIVKHAYSHFKITLHVFECSSRSSEFKARSTDEMKWEEPASLSNYAFPTANKKYYKTF